MKKLHLILLSLVSAIPGGYLCYLLGTALALPRTDLWQKPLLGGAVVGTGLLVLLLAVVWPLLYAVAFYSGPDKGAAEEEESAEADADVAEADESAGFEEEDLDVFEREGVSEDADDTEAAKEFEAAAEGSEFDLEEDNFDSAETADFETLDDGDFEDMELEEEEEEAPQKKKGKDKSKKKKK